jgi:hypothetical protein
MYFRQNPMPSMESMTSQAPMNVPNQMSQPVPMFTYEPFVVQTLQSVMGKMLVVETVKDTLRGTLMDVKPDHIAMQVGDKVFFVRICQIVTVMPD